jgi:hypothetical protein
MAKLLAGGLVLASLLATLALAAGPADSCFPLGAGSCVRVPLPIVATASQLPAACTKGEVVSVAGASTGLGCTTTGAYQLCICTTPGSATAWTVVP